MSKEIVIKISGELRLPAFDVFTNGVPPFFTAKDIATVLRDEFGSEDYEGTPRITFYEDFDLRHALRYIVTYNEITTVIWEGEPPEDE